MDTSLCRVCIEECLRVVKKEGMVDLFPARVVAVGALFVGLKKKGMHLTHEDESSRLRDWVDEVTSGKVEFEDFEELVTMMKGSDE